MKNLFHGPALAAGILFACLAPGCAPHAPKGACQMEHNGSRDAWDFHNVRENTVRDRLWIWAHEASVYNGSWGLPGTMRITPVEGAFYMGVPNIIFIRYNNLPPVENDRQYYVPFRRMKRVVWSLTGGSGVTSREEQEMALRLAAENRNLVGFFMDDFFHNGGEGAAEWLAENSVRFPVTLTIRLPRPARVAEIALEQTDWHSGDYRSSDFEVRRPAADGSWRTVARGTLPDLAGASARVRLDNPEPSGDFEVRILATHDTSDARSCGLRRVRLFDETGAEISLDGAEAEADSVYPGHPAECVLTDEPAGGGQGGAMSVEEVRRFRDRCLIDGVQRELGVTFYTHNVGASAQPYFELIDVLGLWTWRAEDLSELERNLARAEEEAPECRVWLGCYMWDFGANKPMPLEAMQGQCELGLKWMEKGRIDGMIFLATNICDLELETVEWTRRWIEEVGDRPVPPAAPR